MIQAIMCIGGYTIKFDFIRESTAKYRNMWNK